MTKDTDFQGLNLINGTGEKLTVEFSTDTSSTLVVDSVDVTEGKDGLAIRQALTVGGTTSSPLNVSFGFSTGGFTLLGSGAGDTIDVTFAGESATSLASGTFTFSYGSVTITYQVASVGATTQGTFTTTQTFAKGTTFSFDLGFATNAFATALNVVTVSGLVSGASITLGKVTGQYIVDSAFTTQINNLVTDLQSALDTLRTKTKTLGSNVALLQTRLDFTDNYVNTLQTGADKLTWPTSTRKAPTCSPCRPAGNWASRPWPSPARRSRGSWRSSGRIGSPSRIRKWRASRPPFPTRARGTDTFPASTAMLGKGSGSE